MSDQLFGRQPAFHQPGQCRRLNNGALARPAAILQPPGDDGTKLRWDHIEPFRLVLADDVHGATTAWAASRRRLDDVVDTRKMFWQSTAVDMTVLAARHLQSRVILLFLSFIPGIGLIELFENEPQLLGIDLL